MKIWKRLKALSIGQLWQLALVFLKQPVFIIPTLRATKRTFTICNELYGSSHHKSNQANAFRHALWNALICIKVHKKTQNKQKSVFWAQKISDLYEKVTNNEMLDEAMDLHNNGIGRICFLNFIDQNESEIVNFIQEKAQKAKKVTTIEEMSLYKTKLVYIH